LQAIASVVRRTSPVAEIKDFERVPENLVTAGRKLKLAARPCILGVMQLQAIASVVIIESRSNFWKEILKHDAYKRKTKWKQEKPGLRMLVELQAHP
jgi:hypothetical protein